MKIYITLAGLDGYLPQYCTFFDTYEKAAEYLIGIHGIEDTELAKELRKELRKEGFFYLKDSYHRDKYAKIIEHDLDYLQIYIRKTNQLKKREEN